MDVKIVGSLLLLLLLGLCTAHQPEVKMWLPGGVVSFNEQAIIIVKTNRDGQKDR